jgi:hypothetical protein
VVEQLAAFHAARERSLVEHVAADGARASLLELRRGRFRARERDHLVAALDQSRGQRATDQPAAARQEDARHVRKSAVSVGIARTR